MKKKNIIIIITVVVILLGLIGFFGYRFIDGMKKDREETLYVMEEILAKYDEFKPMLEQFTAKRSDFYKLKDENLFLENIREGKENIELFMSEYEQTVIDIHEKNEFLKNYCTKKYSNNKINNRCDLYKQGYEAAVNYYLTDLEVYNEIIKNYNEWIITVNAEEQMEELKFSLYDSFIDYDNDGSYLGGK